MTGPLSSQRLDEIAAHVPNCRYGCEACEAFPALLEAVIRGHMALNHPDQATSAEPETDGVHDEAQA